ncbi:hypothetical protein NL676_005552 [Syzygium grande]|nr:hypothetical protein NL676_005552 [Syzygium grande]
MRRRRPATKRLRLEEHRSSSKQLIRKQMGPRKTAALLGTLARRGIHRGINGGSSGSAGRMGRIGGAAGRRNAVSRFLSGGCGVLGEEGSWSAYL